MKLTLDVWYELWQRSGSEGDTEPKRHLEEEDGYYPSREDYLAWIRGKEARSDSR
jgi:hypothetical protein